jgi:hypothetical protein
MEFDMVTKIRFALGLALLLSLLFAIPVFAGGWAIVRIFPAPVQSPATATPESITPMTATPASQSSTLITFLDQIAGETFLANAQEIVEYPLLLPTHPSGLGPPRHVYVQDANGVMTVLVWVDAQQPGRAAMSLHFIPEGTWMIEKFHPTVIEETEVNGRRAVWAVGSYPLMLRNGDMEFTRLVDGHVLIWVDDDITYRLETNLSLEEAIRIAESLQPVP